MAGDIPVWGWMDFTKFDRVREQLFFLFNYINDLKEENRELKRKVYSLEKGLNEAKSGPIDDSLKARHSDLIEERDRLVMERELIRKKVEAVMERLENAMSKEGV